MNPAIPPKTIEKLKNNGAFDMQDKYFNEFGKAFEGYSILKETPDEYLARITKAYNEEKTQQTTKHSE